MGETISKFENMNTYKLFESPGAQFHYSKILNFGCQLIQTTDEEGYEDYYILAAETSPIIAFIKGLRATKDDFEKKHILTDQEKDFLSIVKNNGNYDVEKGKDDLQVLNIESAGDLQSPPSSPPHSPSLINPIETLDLPKFFRITVSEYYTYEYLINSNILNQCVLHMCRVLKENSHSWDNRCPISYYISLNSTEINNDDDNNGDHRSGDMKNEAFDLKFIIPSISYILQVFQHNETDETSTIKQLTNIYLLISQIIDSKMEAPQIVLEDNDIRKFSLYIQRIKENISRK